MAGSRGLGVVQTTGNAPARRAVINPVFALGPAPSHGWAVEPDPVEAELAEFDEHEVDHDHDRERGEEAGR